MIWVDDEVNALDRYLDKLYASQSPEPLLLNVPGRPHLLPLAQLARHLKRSLTPLEPCPIFRQQLHDRLVAHAAARSHRHRFPWSEQHNKKIVIGAAVGSLVSMAGVLAFVIHWRSTTRQAA